MDSRQQQNDIESPASTVTATAVAAAYAAAAADADADAATDADTDADAAANAAAADDDDANAADADTATDADVLSVLPLKPIDALRVQNAINETGTNACGIIGIDIWTMKKNDTPRPSMQRRKSLTLPLAYKYEDNDDNNNNDGCLYHFGTGMNWINPLFRQQLIDNGDTEKLRILQRLTDAACGSDYFHPFSEPSGVGLAGNYWQQYGDIAGSKRYFQDKLRWRKVKAFTSDPHQFSTARMVALGQVFGKCTGVPFDIFGESKGVVVFFARTTAEERIINTEVNSNFLRLASYNIGSAIAMSSARVRSEQSRKDLTTRLFKKARMAFMVMTLFRKSISKLDVDLLSDDDDDDGKKKVVNDYDRDASGTTYNSSSKKKINWRQSIQETVTATKSVASYTKTKAMKLKSKTLHPPSIKPPPAGSLYVSSYSFMGSFIIFLTLFGLKQLFETVSGESATVIIAPFGALLALQFSLTAAPAAQPRNSFYGSIVALFIVMVMKIVLHHLAGLPLWFTASLGGGGAIFALQKLGFVHPPAAAAAMVFGTNTVSIASDCANAGIFLFCDIVVIALAVFFNNLSETRQYPMYWSLNPFQR